MRFWFLARIFGPEGRNTMWKGFQKPKRLASELESLTEKYGGFPRSLLSAAGARR